MKNETNIYATTEQPWVECAVHLRYLETQAAYAKYTGTLASAIAAWVARHVTHYERLWEGGDRTPELHDDIMSEKFDAAQAMKEVSS